MQQTCNAKHPLRHCKAGLEPAVPGVGRCNQSYIYTRRKRQGDKRPSNVLVYECTKVAMHWQSWVSLRVVHDMALQVTHLVPER